MAGLIENITNSAQLRLGLGLSLAKVEDPIGISPGDRVFQQDVGASQKSTEYLFGLPVRSW